MRSGWVAKILSTVSKMYFPNGQYFLLKLINLKDLSRCPCCPWFLTNSKIYNTYYTIIYNINRADRQTIGQLLINIKKDSKMKIINKANLMAVVQYVLPIYDNNLPIPECQTLLQELSCGKIVTDHSIIQIPDGDVIIIFYDDDCNPKPKVVKAFLGRWENNGFTFDIEQHYGYKFTPIKEVEVFPRDVDVYQFYDDSREIFYNFKNPVKLLDSSGSGVKR